MRVGEIATKRLLHYNTYHQSFQRARVLRTTYRPQQYTLTIRYRQLGGPVLKAKRVGKLTAVEPEANLTLAQDASGHDYLIGNVSRLPAGIARLRLVHPIHKARRGMGGSIKYVRYRLSRKWYPHQQYSFEIWSLPIYSRQGSRLVPTNQYAVRDDMIYVWPDSDFMELHQLAKYPRQAARLQQKLLTLRRHLGTDLHAPSRRHRFLSASYALDGFVRWTHLSPSCFSEPFIQALNRRFDRYGSAETLSEAAGDTNLQKEIRYLANVPKPKPLNLMSNRMQDFLTTHACFVKIPGNYQPEQAYLARPKVVFKMMNEIVKHFLTARKEAAKYAH